MPRRRQYALAAVTSSEDSDGHGFTEQQGDNRMIDRVLRPALTASLLALAASGALGQLAVSANDNKATLDNGTNKVVASPPADTVTVIDLGAKPPKVVAELNVPTSVVGPPMSVAVSPDESLALV